MKEEVFKKVDQLESEFAISKNHLELENQRLNNELIKLRARVDDNKQRIRIVIKTKVSGISES